MARAASALSESLSLRAFQHGGRVVSKTRPSSPLLGFHALVLLDLVQIGGKAILLFQVTCFLA